MSNRHTMRLHVGDYLGDTLHLKALEHGAYLLLLMAMWRAGGTLPANDANLSSIARCTAAEWARIKPVVLAFFKVRRGVLSHKRVAEEIANTESISCSRKEAVKAREEKRALKNSELASSSDEQRPITHIPRPIPLEDTTPQSAGAPAHPPGNEDWPADPLAGLAAMSMGRLDPNKQPGLLQSSGEITRWKLRGCSWGQDVLPVVRAKLAKSRTQVRSWSFFTEAIFDAMDRRLAPIRPVENVSNLGDFVVRSPSRQDEKLARRHENYRRAVEGAMEAPNRHL